MTIRTRRTSSERTLLRRFAVTCGLLGLAAVASGGCNAIGGLGSYQIQVPDVSNCGVNHEDCAKSLSVPGGAYCPDFDPVSIACTPGPTPKRSDGSACDSIYVPFCGCGTGETCCDAKFPCDAAHAQSGCGGMIAPPKATVSDFRLDKFEVTVGRFRVFVNEVVLTKWNPPPGAGRHTHLPGGGLKLADGSGIELGWNGQSALPTVKGEWDLKLTPNAFQCTWTKDPGPNEKLPINCITWPEAYAFCIWDGGFLPSEMEWNYAVTGPSALSDCTDQHVYPWGNDAPDPMKLLIYGCGYPTPEVNEAEPWLIGKCDSTGAKNIAPVGWRPAGDGPFGHSDLAGSVLEWTLDTFAPPPTKECENCTVIDGTSTNRIVRGEPFWSGAVTPTAAHRTQRRQDDYRSDYVGVRCARSPLP
jgi:formylglycine-generating enzyme required for sulfatase activity